MRVGIDIIDLKELSSKFTSIEEIRTLIHEVFVTDKPASLEELASYVAVNEAVFKSLEDRWQKSYRGVHVTHKKSGKPQLLLDFKLCPFLLRYSIDVSVSHHGDILTAIAISNPIKLHRRMVIKLSSLIHGKQANF
jgi:phosphopantetheinyl transferase (holo-ACP synthase)